ncbi:hypothetical protein [Tatumella sp. JGM118]|uniref:hypothetical protein n=1 Tax=Tatumella sp. JGM118 TaxID=2799796 RepID=UPI001BAE6A0D|nr:hypothetical protein [Tatumella sp. JGM118]MBS0909197.1 hypothetical protein [Tatumella sp. JGM118]
MKFITWLKSLFNREKEKMSDQSVVQPEATQPAAAQPAAETAQPAVAEAAVKPETGIVATVERDLGQFYSIVKELEEKYGPEYIEFAIDFAKAVSAKQK